MLFNNPISVERVDRIISILRLNADCKVLDIGCGEGELLLRIKSATNADCLGIDIDPVCINKAVEKLHKKEFSDKCRFVADDVQKAQLKKNSFDLAMCVGSTHAFGMGDIAYPNSLKQMIELVKPNGLILVGEGYWKCKPEKEYTDFIGEPIGIYNDHEQNIEQAESLGLVPLYAATSNQDEWDHFEWSFRMKAEHRFIENPDDDEAQKKLQNVREWNKNYRKYGRTTMGFGFYLFQKQVF